MSVLGTAVIVGVGEGLGASLCRRFAIAGHPIAMAARNIDKLTPLISEITKIGAKVKAFKADATKKAEIAQLFSDAESHLGQIEITIFNVGTLYRSSIVNMPDHEFENVWRTSCFGGMIVGREAARIMLPRSRGTILFTGGRSSRKAEAELSAFAVGKFGLRAVAESMARELAPKGIHVSHFVIEGFINNLRGRELRPEKLEQDGLVSTKELAELYYQTHCQPKSCWTFEVDLRAWSDPF